MIIDNKILINVTNEDIEILKGFLEKPKMEKLNCYYINELKRLGFNDNYLPQDKRFQQLFLILNQLKIKDNIKTKIYEIALSNYK